MIRRIPIIPTIIVLAAVATMIALGVWQLGRAEEKKLLIERYSEATENEEATSFPLGGTGEAVWFRRSEIDCRDVGPIQPVAGRAANGAKGWAMRTNCAVSEDAAILVDLGFSPDLSKPEWDGGLVSGVIAPGPRLIANPPVAGLEPLAKPDPGDLPNNHLAYAGQWFFFALTALVIYGFALRSRASKRD
ncbi:MAG: SURF1 family protein [Pseudomonadota bacterium]